MKNVNTNNTNTPDLIFSSYQGDETAFAVPSGVVWIEDGAFRNNKSIKKVTIPEGVLHIGAEAFMGCTSLESISLPNSLKNISERAFMGCTSLETAFLPRSIVTISPKAFMDCTSLEMIVIDDVKSIGDEAFRNCTSLELAYVYENCEEIGFNAFNGCTSLEYVQLPDTVTEICGGAFDGCTKLKDVKSSLDLMEIFDECFEGCDLLKTTLESRAKLYAKLREGSIAAVIVNNVLECFDDTVSTECVIPEGVKVIAADAFKGCTRLEKITIPESMEEIELGAFDDCISLSVINVPDNCTLMEPLDLYSTKWYKDRRDGLVVLGTVVLEYGGSEKLIQLPEGVTSIFEDAFESCAPDCELVLPKNARCIKQGAVGDTGAALLTVHY